MDSFLRFLTEGKNSHHWLDDQRHFDETGQQPNWRSQNPHVPRKYRLDLEFNCYTNAENLVRANPKLTYAEGHARLKGNKNKTAWGEHAWAETPTGKIVDPYFEWKFPNRSLEYRKRITENKDKDVAIAAAIQHTLDKGRKVEISGKRISQADWDKDPSNPHKSATPPAPPAAPERSKKVLKPFKSLIKRKLVYEGKVGHPVRIEKWYDKQSKNWIVQKLDAEGNQVGDAGIAGTKAGANAYHKEFQEHIEDQKKNK